MKIIMTLGLVGLALFSLSAQEKAEALRPEPQTIQMVNVDTWLQNPIDRYSKKGEAVTAVVLAAAKLNDGTPLVEGSLLQGRVDEIVVPPKKGNSSVVLTFDKITLTTGQQITVKATLVHIRIPSYTKVNPLERVTDRAGFSGGSDHQNPPDQPASLSSPGGEPVLADMRGLSLTSSMQDTKSGTLTLKGKNWYLPKGSHLEVGLAVLPPNAILVAQ